MFSWFGRPVWTRKTRWSPLLENQREFQRSISKERARVERNGSSFGFMILRLESAHAIRRDTKKLGKLLHRRLRTTDEKGHLGPARIGVILPETGRKESAFVLSEVLRLAGKQRLPLRGEFFVYPEDKDSGTPGHKHEELVGQADGSQNSEHEEQLSAAHHYSVGSPLATILPEYPAWKRLIDLAGASVGLMVSAPFLLAAALAIKLTSRGPVLFAQMRTGYMGQPFKIYKLRTMVVNAEAIRKELEKDNERDGPAFKMRQDPRVTLVGRLLRATAIDELPQLINVIKGDMSLVGPRPLPVAEAAQCNAWQERRQDVKPGLTCTWQIAKSRQIPFQEWMRMDILYSRRLSLRQDLKLILRTISSVVLGRAGH